MKKTERWKGRHILPGMNIQQNFSTQTSTHQEHKTHFHLNDFSQNGSMHIPCQKNDQVPILKNTVCITTHISINCLTEQTAMASTSHQLHSTYQYIYTHTYFILSTIFEDSSLLHPIINQMWKDWDLSTFFVYYNSFLVILCILLWLAWHRLASLSRYT